MDAPAYSWTCHVCEASNPTGQPACTACGATPPLSAVEVAAAKERLRGIPAGPKAAHSGMSESRPGRKTGSRSTGTPGFRLADCLIVAMVVLPSIAFACLFVPFVWGGTPQSDWLNDTTLLVIAAIAYCAGLLLVLCRWLI